MQPMFADACMICVIYDSIDHQIALDNSVQNMNNLGQELEILINIKKKTVPIINTERQQRTLATTVNCRVV